MTHLEGEYEPSTSEWVRDQVELIESSGGTKGTTLRETGIPVIVVTMRGAKSGKIRKIPLMRVEHEGSYAVIASMGGAPQNPAWYHNLVADPEVEIRDATHVFSGSVRLVTGEERAEWWARAVDVFPNYAEYAEKTDREIPLFVASPS